MFKRGGGGISCEGEVDSRRVAYRCLKWNGLIILGRRGGFSEGRLYMFKGGYILGRMGRFWEDRIICLKGGYNL